MHHLMYYAWISCIMFTVPLLIVIITIVSLSGMPSEDAKVSKRVHYAAMCMRTVVSVHVLVG